MCFFSSLSSPVPATMSAGCCNATWVCWRKEPRPSSKCAPASGPRPLLRLVAKNVVSSRTVLFPFTSHGWHVSLAMTKHPREADLWATAAQYVEELIQWLNRLAVRPQLHPTMSCPSARRVNPNCLIWMWLNVVVVTWCWLAANLHHMATHGVHQHFCESIKCSVYGV